MVQPELHQLAIAHVDADAFYSAVEKREDPTLRDRPVIIGGGRRGVVSTACYIARLSGVRSAMPMFTALKLCPEAVVIAPRMSLYADVSRQIRALMLEFTPMMEPLSLDEAFLDLSGTERLHRAPPAVLLARLQTRIESELGLTVSVGLSHNKFLAKIASEMDKPRGFYAIGRAETVDFLAPRPVSIIWGVGRSAVAALEAEGIRTIADLRTRDHSSLQRRFGSMGDRLWHLARGEDTRPVRPDHAVKSISNETTFPEDLSDPDRLQRHLWSLAETVSARAKTRGLAGSVVTLKIKRTDHTILTRRQTLAARTMLADRIFRTAVPLLASVLSEGPFRLIGIGLSDLAPGDADTEQAADLFNSQSEKRHRAERVADKIRGRFGTDAILFGRSLR